MARTCYSGFVKDSYGYVKKAKPKFCLLKIQYQATTGVLLSL